MPAKKQKKSAYGRVIPGGAPGPAKKRSKPKYQPMPKRKRK